MLVVKIGGRTFEEPAGRARLLLEIASLRRDVVVVHGGGHRVTSELAASGVAARFVGGLRVTDEATMAVVERVLTLAGKEIAQGLTSAGAPAVSLTGRDAALLAAERRAALGLVGRVTHVEGKVLRELLRAGLVPVLAPLALDPDGVLLNVNADEVAGAVAAALGARLLLLTDVDQVRGPDGPLATLTAADARRLVADGWAKDGMQPKLEAALVAAAAGARVTIANGNAPGAVAKAVAGAVGTEVTP